MSDVDLFIQSIHERPSLWEKSCKEYSDKHKKEKSWMEIGEVLYENWLNLRQMRERKNVHFMFMFTAISIISLTCGLFE